MKSLKECYELVGNISPGMEPEALMISAVQLHRNYLIANAISDTAKLFYQGAWQESGLKDVLRHASGYLKSKS